MVTIHVSRPWVLTILGGLAAFAALLLVTQTSPRQPVPVPAEPAVTSWVTEYVDPETPVVTVGAETPTVAATTVVTTTTTKAAQP